MRRYLLASSWGLLLACSGPPPAPSPAAPPAAPAAAPTPPTPAPPPAPPAASEEACGQIIVVAYKGAAHAKPEVQRDKAAAGNRAFELLSKIITAGADFAELARAESDAPSSAPHGGIMGSFTRQDWPALHQVLLGPVFGLKVGQVGVAPIEADYGYVLVRRCAVEKAHGRHILIRYKGAKNAPKQTKRSKQDAQKLAAGLLKKLEAGADFAALVRSASEDSSAKNGGDVGLQARGVLAMPFEQALFALKPGQHSGVVETEFGFHIIERLPD
jgi:parvulin-like peptidyl-prolyl isomerase